MSRVFLGLLVFALWTLGCGGSPAPPTVAPPSATAVPSGLESAPTSVSFAGKTLTLESFPYRDFMGNADSSLHLVLTVKTSDGSAVPPVVTVSSVWALNGSTTWSTWTLSSQTGSTGLVVDTRNGPFWDPGTWVASVVQLQDTTGNVALLRALPPRSPLASAFDRDAFHLEVCTSQQ